MYRKTAWLIGALALCLWAWSPGTASADQERHGHGVKHHKHDRHFGKHRSHDHHAFKHRGHRHHARKHHGFPRHGFSRHGFRGHGFRGYGFRGHGFRHHGRPYSRHGVRKHIYGGTAFVVRPYYVSQALERASDGQAIVWNEPRDQAQYEVVPTQTYQTRSGRYCREYLSTATIGGQTREVYGQACRQTDGSWEILR